MVADFRLYLTLDHYLYFLVLSLPNYPYRLKPSTISEVFFIILLLTWVFFFKTSNLTMTQSDYFSLPLLSFLSISTPAPIPFSESRLLVGYVTHLVLPGSV